MPADVGSGERWRQIGEQLLHRRVQIDIRYRNRMLFCRERGVGDRLVYDIENARRSNYERSTLTALDVAYELPPGTLYALSLGLTAEQAAVLAKAPEAFAALAHGDTEAHESNGAGLAAGSGDGGA